MGGEGGVAFQEIKEALLKTFLSVLFALYVLKNQLAAGFVGSMMGV